MTTYHNYPITFDKPAKANHWQWISYVWPKDEQTKPYIYLESFTGHDKANALSSAKILIDELMESEMR